jgi:hypothetical protein
MPLTAKGQEILAALEKEYGPEKGKSVLYAGKNKGTFTGIDSAADDLPEHEDEDRKRFGSIEGRLAKLEIARHHAVQLAATGRQLEARMDTFFAAKTDVDK